MENRKPWEQLEELIKTEDRSALKSYLDILDADNLVSAINHISQDKRVQLLHLVDSKDAAEIINNIPEVQAVSMLEDVPTSRAADIISEMRSDEQADILNEMEDDAEAIMVHMERRDETNIRTLVNYHPDTAGGLMITEFLAFDKDQTVDQVANNLRNNSEQYEGYNVQYIYVTDRNKFLGVLQMRDLLLSKANTPLSKIVVKTALTVADSATIDDLINFFDTHDFYGVPVVNDQQILLGVVLRKDMREAEAEKSNKELLETQGIIGGEELRTMPVFLRARRRLSWLSVNILLNILAAGVIALYQDTLTSVIALAVFLPVISDMSGCSGNQAVAVSLRELALGVVRPYEVMRVWFQEVSVGLINGLALGLLIGIVAWLWQGNIYLGIAVGGALSINTVVAVSLGGILPLVLKRLDFDPALASGPILTTVTDMMGFFLALSFAASLMNYLV